MAGSRGGRLYSESLVAYSQFFFPMHHQHHLILFFFFSFLFSLLFSFACGKGIDGFGVCGSQYSGSAVVAWFMRPVAHPLPPPPLPPPLPILQALLPVASLSRLVFPWDDTKEKKRKEKGGFCPNDTTRWRDSETSPPTSLSCNNRRRASRRRRPSRPSCCTAQKVDTEYSYRRWQRRHQDDPSTSELIKLYKRKGHQEQAKRVLHPHSPSLPLHFFSSHLVFAMLVKGRVWTCRRLHLWRATTV